MLSITTRTGGSIIRYRKEIEMQEKKIDRLYELLERIEKEKDAELTAALRWAIFTLEQAIG